MRQDIKDLLEENTTWQEMNPVDPIEISEVLPVEQAIDSWRTRDPAGANLVAAFVVAKRQGDDKIAQQVWDLIKLHSETATRL